MRERGLTDEERDQRSRQAIRLNLGRFLHLGYYGPRWTRAQWRLLGKEPDDVVAVKIGRGEVTVRAMRNRLGIPTARDRRRKGPAGEQAPKRPRGRPRAPRWYDDLGRLSRRTAALARGLAREGTAMGSTPTDSLLALGREPSTSSERACPTANERLRGLGMRLPYLAEDLVELDKPSGISVPSGLNKIRFITEKVLHGLCTGKQVSWGEGEPTLERMIGPLVSAACLPKSVATHVRTHTGVLEPWFPLPGVSSVGQTPRHLQGGPHRIPGLVCHDRSAVGMAPPRTETMVELLGSSYRDSPERRGAPDDNPQPVGRA
jgi:hypothetical protein